jgi:hypothetical protein
MFDKMHALVGKRPYTVLLEIKAKMVYFSWFFDWGAGYSSLEAKVDGHPGLPNRQVLSP